MSVNLESLLFFFLISESGISVTMGHSGRQCECIFITQIIFQDSACSYSLPKKNREMMFMHL